MASPFAEVLRALAAALRSLGSRWYLFGAQAAIVHGAERLTTDVDVTVDIGERPTTSLVRALERSGFALRVSATDFVERTRVLPVRHRKHGIDVDVVLAGPGPEQLFLERAVRRKIENVWVPVASAEDLIAMKILSGRPKDMEDVTEILAAQTSRVRVGRIRRTLRALETALDQSDLVPAFEALADAVRLRPPSSRSRRPQPRKPRTP